MKITHYDIYNNCEGKNIVRRRPWRWEVKDAKEIEQVRRRLETLGTRYLRNERGRRYKHISACFEINER